MAEVVNARSSDDRHERPDVRAVDRGEWRHDCREYLREFMEAYGQEVGYSVAQVAWRCQPATASASPLTRRRLGGLVSAPRRKLCCASPKFGSVDV